MSSDECFDEFIEYDNAQSTSQGKKRMRKKATESQFQKLFDFTQSHNKKTLGKETYNQLWDTLVCQLNKLGPPEHTSEKWRNIWSVYKSKKKIKLSSVEKVQTKETEEQDSSSSAVVDKHKQKTRSKKEALKVDYVEVMPIYLERLKEHRTPSLSPPSKKSKDENSGDKDKNDVMITLTKQMSKDMRVMIEEQRKTNDLLEKLLAK